MERIVIEYEPIPGRRRRFLVRGRRLDGSVTVLGQIEYRRFPHVRQFAWDTTRADGHCGVHDEQWQAAAALILVGRGSYPFPIIRPTWLA